MMEQDETGLAAEVRELVETMYAGYLSGDRSAIDAMLSPRLTMFDSAAPELIDGMAELQKVRDARPGADGSPPFLRETALVPDRFTARELGSAVVATWWLRIDAEDSEGNRVSPEVVRNSAVLSRGVDGGLMIEHIHEDVLQGFGGER